MPTQEPQLEREQSAVVVAPEPPMHHVPAAVRWLSYLLLSPLILLATACFGTLSLLAGLWDHSGRQQHAIARMWARVLLRCALSPLTLEHPERLQHHATAVYACNHLSYYDTPALFATLPFQFRILANANLWKIPFIGWYLRHSGQVPVDSSSARAGVASLMRGVRTLESGLSIALFPEGGRSPHGQTRKMVAGAAWMAIKAQVPLVPLTLIGTYELMPMHVYALNPRPLKLVVGEPISTIGLSTRDSDALTERVFDEIFRTYTAGHRL